MKPLVSILVPTFNRRKFIPQLLRNFDKQVFPHNEMEIIIVDDGDEPIEDLLSLSRYYRPNNRNKNRIIYEKLARKLPLGEKRNLLNDMAKGEILISMDDDDWYSSKYVKTLVRTLKQTDLLICGASRIFAYTHEFNAILRLGPYGPYHTCNHLIGYKRAYLNNHMYDSSTTSGEEESFTNKHTEPLVQIENSEKIFLLIRHEGNITDFRTMLDQVGLDYSSNNKKLVKTQKYEMLTERGISPVLLTDMSIKDFIKRKDERMFYRDLFTSKPGK